MLSGTVGAQLITLMALPLLSRLYSPEEFGYFSLVLALTAIVGPAATLRFETAAMLPAETRDVRALVWNALLVSVGVALLSGGVLQVITWSGITDLSKYDYISLWVGAMVLIYALFAIFSQLSLRNRQYALVSQRSVVRAGVTAAGQLGLGLLGQGAAGLTAGAALGNLAGLIAMAKSARTYLHYPGRAALGEVWRNYWRFPVLFTPSALLNALGLQAPLVGFTLIYGVSIGGQLGMAERIVGLPITLVGVAIGQVIDAEVSKRVRERSGGLHRTYVRYSSALVAIAALVALGFGVLGGWVVPWLLGADWALAGTVVQIMAITSAVRLLGGPLSKFLVLLQRPMLTLSMDVLRVVIVALGFSVVLSLGIDLIPALWIVYSGLSATYLVTWVCGLVAARQEDVSVRK
ncbi:lipopolysaccharide biosynthesis protein [Microbacterium sp. KHB019]|uniref:lipopolysaccharide biosynthesis protein n=1 Tax=Microbacterium sp. KHB019 TaxID=3129770 RepID=UPI00307A7B5A